MKFNEAIATANTDMFSDPLLFAKFDKRDNEAQRAISKLKLMKIDKRKDKSLKYLDKILYSKSRMF